MYKHGVMSALLLILLVSLPAQAAQHWVSVSGDDSAPGTAGRPFRTIARGVAVARARAVDMGEHFGGPNGVIELTVDQPEGKGHIDLYARVQPNAKVCAQVTRNGSRFISLAGIEDSGGGSILQTAATRLDPSSTVRLAVVGQGCALNVGDQWVLLSRLPASLSAGGFYVVSDSMEVQKVRFAPLD